MDTKDAIIALECCYCNVDLQIEFSSLAVGRREYWYVAVALTVTRCTNATWIFQEPEYSYQELISGIIRDISDVVYHYTILFALTTHTHAHIHAESVSHPACIREIEIKFHVSMFLYNWIIILFNSWTKGIIYESLIGTTSSLFFPRKCSEFKF